MSIEPEPERNTIQTVNDKLKEMNSIEVSPKNKEKLGQFIKNRKTLKQIK